MKNKLIDLNNHLFAQLERLNDESLSADQLQDEIERSRAVAGISKEVVSNARLAMEADKYRRDYGIITPLPEMLEHRGKNDALD